MDRWLGLARRLNRMLHGLAMLDPSRPRHNYYCYSTCDDASSASASARSDALLRAGALCRLGGGASSSAGAGALPYAPKFSSSASAAAAEPYMSRVGAHRRALGRVAGVALQRTVLAP